MNVEFSSVFTHITQNQMLLLQRFYLDGSFYDEFQ